MGQITNFDGEQIRKIMKEIREQAKSAAKKNDIDDQDQGEQCQIF